MACRTCAAGASRSPIRYLLPGRRRTLRVTKVDDLRPQPFTVFGWLVRRTSRLIRELPDRETDMLRYEGFDEDDDLIWTTPNSDLVAWFQDPDANVLSLTRSPPDLSRTLTHLDETERHSHSLRSEPDQVPSEALPSELRPVGPSRSASRADPEPDEDVWVAAGVGSYRSCTPRMRK